MRVAGVLPYVPLLRTERGPAIWGEVQSFFGIADDFPADQAFCPPCPSFLSIVQARMKF